MANQASYQGISSITATASAVAIARGVRVTRANTGLIAVQDASARGDYTTLHAIEASGTGEVARNGIGKVPALASEAVAVGDLAYTAAAGKFSKTAGGNILMGRWTMAASGDGVLGEVELFTVA